MSKKKKTIQTIYEAIANNDLAEIQNFLKKGENINQVNSDGMTPVTFAVATVRLECAKLLVSLSADCGIVDAKGLSALHYAILYKNYDLMHEILNTQGKRLSKTVPELVHFIVSEGRIGQLEKLLNAGWSPFHKDQNGITPLHEAFRTEENWHFSMPWVKKLDLLGVNLMAMDNQGLHPVHYGIMNKKMRDHPLEFLNFLKTEKGIDHLCSHFPKAPSLLELCLRMDRDSEFVEILKNNLCTCLSLPFQLVLDFLLKEKKRVAEGYKKAGGCLDCKDSQGKTLLVHILEKDEFNGDFVNTIFDKLKFWDEKDSDGDVHRKKLLDLAAKHSGDRDKREGGFRRKEEINKVLVGIIAN